MRVMGHCGSSHWGRLRTHRIPTVDRRCETMTLRSFRIVAMLATLVAVQSCGGADGLAPSSSATGANARTSDSTLLAGLSASGPIANASIGFNRSAVQASVGPSAQVSWVSLVPGTVPDGGTATIVNLATAESITTAIMEGGFDPQPIPARLGDTIQVAVSRAGRPDAAALLSVVPRPAPRLVRTRPPRGQTDAPLNTIITLAFSEPLEPALVNATSITLTTAGSPVAGAVRVVPGPGYTVEFTPAALLAPNTTYALAVSGVVNLAGTPLAAPASIPFTTSAVGSGSVDPSPYDALGLSFQDVGTVTGDTIEMRAHVHRGRGQSTEALEWTSSDPSVASIRLLDTNTNLIEVRALRTRCRHDIRPHSSDHCDELSARASVDRYSPARASPRRSSSMNSRSWSRFFAMPVLRRLRPTCGSAIRALPARPRSSESRSTSREPISALSCAPNRVLGAGSWNRLSPTGRPER